MNDGKLHCWQIAIFFHSLKFKKVKQPFRLQKWLLRVVHIIKMKSQSVALPARGCMPESIGCKFTTLN